MPDLIFVSLENWDEIWRRNQFLCAKMVERNPDCRILFVEPPTDMSYVLRTGRTSALARPGVNSSEVMPGVTRTRPFKLFPNASSAGRSCNQWIFRQHVRRAARNLGFESPVLWINPHWAESMAGKTGECGVIYDVTDDWTAFKESPGAAARTRMQDAKLCRIADDVIVCSERLLEMKRSIARRVTLVPNGVDAEHYAAAMDEAKELPEETRSWNRPVFGYTGTVHSSRIDIALVKAAAESLPTATFAFVGPNMLFPDDLNALSRVPNVVFLGPRPYSKIPEYMRAFDVCMAPHLVSPFTESLNPIKLWEYLAVGKPIVSTPVAGFRDHPSLVHLARTPGEFADALSRALLEPRILAANRRAMAAKHSWDNRVAQVEKIIGGLKQKHRPVESPIRQRVNS